MLLVFDCDGVLVDSEILHSEIESAVGRELVGVQRTPAAHNALFSGRGLKNVYLTWERETGTPLPAGLEDEMARRKREAFSVQLKAVPFIVEALQQLTSYQKCVASGTPLDMLDVSLRTTGLFDFFTPYLFSSESVQRGKPAPDIFLFAAERMGAAPAECLVVEDSVHGVQAAVAAGMPVLGYFGASNCGAGWDEQLRQAGACRVFNDMLELPELVRSCAGA